MSESPCVLCVSPGGEVLWDDGFARVVLATGEADHPGFCRVILNAHVKEMTDLPPADRERVMQVVYAVEELMRQTLRPDKMNLASLGNLVPHLHWHLIARYADDPHFPAPVWAPRKDGQPRALPPGFARAMREGLKARFAQ